MVMMTDGKLQVIFSSKVQVIKKMLPLSRKQQVWEIYHTSFLFPSEIKPVPIMLV